MIRKYIAWLIEWAKPELKVKRKAFCCDCKYSNYKDCRYWCVDQQKDYVLGEVYTEDCDFLNKKGDCQYFERSEDITVLNPEGGRTFTGKT